MITALYDCRSKQEYIYRTNRIREISGASKILSDVYGWLLEELKNYNINICNTWDTDTEDFDKEAFERSEYDGVVIYEGGGNLYMLYRSVEIFQRANCIFSHLLLEKTHSVSIIAAWTETGQDFCEDREELYRTKTRVKNLGTYSVPCNVLPFTMLDRQTFMPICSREMIDQKSEWTREALLKQQNYEKYSSECNTDWLDELVQEKGFDSMLAVIYIDGNDMGNKIKRCTEGMQDYTKSVSALRRFSLNTNKCFVKEPLEAIEACLEKLNQRDEEKYSKGKLPKPPKPHKYRRIIGGGDEITLICRASDAAQIVLTYFDTLEQTENLVSDTKNASCAGIAIFHSHAPFADVYEIAEACCDSGKKKTRESESKVSYIDFHYCHAGITNELEVLRDEQEKEYTARPYTVEEFREFLNLMKKLAADDISRSNVKTLGEAIIKGDGAYQFELERICARDTKREFIQKVRDPNIDQEKLKQQIYDASIVFDLWAEKEEK